MSQLYSQSSLLTIELETGYNLAGVTNTKILFRRPDMTVGDWPATVSGTKLVHEVLNGEINMPGNWSFQAYFEVGGKTAIGKEVITNFKQSNL